MLRKPIAFVMQIDRSCVNYFNCLSLIVKCCDHSELEMSWSRVVSYYIWMCVVVVDVRVHWNILWVEEWSSVLWLANLVANRVGETECNC